MPVNGKAATAVVAGSVLLYSGARGYSLLRAAQNIVRGQSPTANQTVSLLTAGAAPSPMQSSGGSNDLVTIALQGVGHDYVWGGTPGANGQGGWDCSSFMNYVVGARAGMAIPGDPAGAYTGLSHGPNTTMWLVWNGCTTVGNNMSTANVLPGDIIVGPTHMGMVTSINPLEYVSAHDPAEGTTVTKVAGGFPDPIYLFRRLKG